MALLYDNVLSLFLPVEQTFATNFTPYSTVEIAGIPWETFGTGPLQVEITADFKRNSGAAMDGIVDMYLDVPGYGAAWPSSRGQLAFVGAVFSTSYASANDTQTVTGPGIPSSLYIWANVTFAGGFHGGKYQVKNVRVVVHSIEPDVSIDDPDAGVTIAPIRELEFVVEWPTIPTTLVATVTLADGSQEVAWDYDQATDGYNGTLDVVGSVRTYRISRKRGWILGPLSLTVEAT